MTAVAALMILQRPALAGPTGGTVVTGSATISQSGATTNINQSSNSAIINWQTFSIGAKETVNFNQPGINAVTLNRVIGNETSIIAGALNANGKVFLVNSAGVVFTKGSRVNVGGLVASTLDISNHDFMAGHYKFSGTSAASVINRGHITAAPGGYVALLGNMVSNRGVINARLGTVAMSSGSKITLNFAGNSLFDVTISKGMLNALVENKRAIRADGGRVIMTAKAADEVLSAQVNNSGIVQARTIAALKGGGAGKAHAGKIKIVAEGGTANISGKLDASARKGGDGGFIETSGDKVHIADSAVITTKSATGKTGTWLVDPSNYIIAASGGDTTGAALSTRLGTTNVVLTSSQGTSAAPAGTVGGDNNIFVNDAVSWSANTTLTLNAGNKIYVNKPITGTGAGSGIVLSSSLGIDINAASALNAGTVTTTTANTSYIQFNAPQSWTTAHPWSFTGILDINAPVTWSGSAPLTVTASSLININAAMSGTDANSRLSLAGTDINFNVANAFNVKTLTATGNSIKVGLDQTLTPGSSWALNATGPISINGAITANAGSAVTLNAGTDINLNAASALNGPAITVTAGDSVNINEAQTWATDHSWAFTGNLNIYAPVSWAGSTALNVSATKAINVDAAMTGSDANSKLVLKAGTDMNVAGADAFKVGTLTAIAGNAINITGAQTWTNAGQRTLAGDTISVNNAVNWSAGTLTLNAAKNIFVNAPMRATGTANFVANYGHVLDANGNPTATVTPGDDAGHTPGTNADTTPMGLYMALPNPGTYTGWIDFSGSGTVKLGGQDYSVINSVAGLDAIADDLSRNYVLGSNLSNVPLAKLPSASLFSGTFNGLGHSLSLAPVASLSINSPLTIASLKSTNVLLNSTGDITVSAPVTSGAGILTFNAGTNINLNASVSAVSGSTDSIAFVGTNMTIGQSVGVTGANIFINTPVGWTANTLTLNANSNVFVNKVMSASGSAGFTATYGTGTNADGSPNGMYMAMGKDINGVGTFTGRLDFAGSGTLRLQGHEYEVYNALGSLAAAMNNDPTKFYALGGNLDPSTDTGSNYSRGAAPIGTVSTALEGLGHTVKGLTINATAGSNGLISGVAATGSVRNIGLVDVSITDQHGNRDGGLVGENRGTIVNSFADGGSVKAYNTQFSSQIGGLVGLNFGGTIANSWANVDVTGTGSVGGLVGTSQNFVMFVPQQPTIFGPQGMIVNSYAAGAVNAAPSTAARTDFGGLVGTNSGSIITHSYATGKVLDPSRTDGSTINNSTGSITNVGGLVGRNVGDGGAGRSGNAAVISYSYATGNVWSTGDAAGGLVGYNTGGNIDHSYSGGDQLATKQTVTANGGNSIGGLVGLNAPDSTLPGTGVIDTSFSRSDVSAQNSNRVGGVVGWNNAGIVRNSQYFGGTVTGNEDVGGIAGLNQGSLSHIDATGTINGITDVGGIAGQNSTGNQNPAVVSGATFQGTVHGTTNVGGIVGNNSGSISNVSTLPGTVVVGVTNVGGIVGFNAAPDLNQVGGTIRDYNNSTGLPDVGHNDNPDPNSVRQSTAPLPTKAPDGAAAASQAAASQAAQTGSSIGANTQTAATDAPTGAMSAAGTGAATDSKSQAVENNLKNEQQRERRRTAANRPRPEVRRGGNFGATIRSINIDGQRFDLRNNKPGDNKPDSNAPGDGTPAQPDQQ